MNVTQQRFMLRARAGAMAADDRDGLCVAQAAEAATRGGHAGSILGVPFQLHPAGQPWPGRGHAQDVSRRAWGPVQDSGDWACACHAARAGAHAGGR